MILSEEVRAYTNRIDVAYMAEDILIEMGFIERDLHCIPLPKFIVDGFTNGHAHVIIR